MNRDNFLNLDSAFGRGEEDARMMEFARMMDTHLEDIQLTRGNVYESLSEAERWTIGNARLIRGGAYGKGE